MANETIKQIDPIIPRLLPLEYCTPERAARLLGCEVEDIFHWAAIGVIKLYAIFDQFLVEFTNGDTKFAKDNIFISPDLTDKMITPLTLVGGYHVFGYGDDGFKHDARIDFYKKINNTTYDDIIISGLWEIYQYKVSKVNYEASLENELSWDISATYLDENQQSSPLNIALSNVSINNMVERIRVVYEDLTTIREHMFSGKPMTKTSSELRTKRNSQITAESNPHPTAERHAVTREKVLAAAIYTREKWPEECKGNDDKWSATAWAAAIENHAPILFASDSAPLAMDSMTRLLSSALRRGESYQKP